MENNKFTIKNTLGMFDLLKGIIMILVMVCHTYGLMDIVAKYAYIDELQTQINILVFILILVLKTFTETIIPALFIVSGYGFRKTTFKKCFSKQWHTLLIPYTITMILATIINFVSCRLLYGGFQYPLKQTVSVFFGGLLGLPRDIYIHGFRLVTCGPVWFLLSLAIANIIFNLLANHFEDDKLIVAALPVSCIGWVMSLAGPLPWSVSQGFVSVFFLALGHYAKKHKIFVSSIKRSPVIDIIVFSVLVLYMIFIGTGLTFNIANDEYPLGPVSIIQYGFLGMCTTALFLHLNRFEGSLSKFIRKVGCFSLYVLCIHTIEMVTFGGQLQYMFVNDLWKGNLLLRNAIIIGIRIPFVIICTFLFIRIKNALKKHQR